MSLQELLPRLMKNAVIDGAALDTSTRHPLSDVRGMQLRGDGHATWQVDGLRAELTSDALDDIRVCLTLPPPESGRAALDESAELPATWRWAQGRGGLVLLADVSAMSRDALPAIFDDLEWGVRMLNGRRGTRQRNNSATVAVAEEDEAIDKQQLQDVLRAPWWDAQSVVEMPHGWELRPTIDSHVTPVSLVIEGRRVRCQRVIMSPCRDGAVAEAICWQALCENSRLKHARLACVDGKLVAEVCLSREVLSGDTLVAAARAVAVAEHRVRMSLGVLREHEEIATAFVALFAARDVPPG